MKKHTTWRDELDPIDTGLEHKTVAVYLASDVDIREQQATATIQAQRRKIEHYEKALREIVEHYNAYDDNGMGEIAKAALGISDQSNSSHSASEVQK